MASRRYIVKIPHPRGKLLSSDIGANSLEAPVIDPSLTDINDMYIHALFARIATSAGYTHEFGTTYDPNTNTIEIDVPEEVLSFIEGVEVKPNIQRFIAWLTSNSQYWSKYIDSRGDVGLKTDFRNIEVSSITYRDVYDNGTSSEIDWKYGNKQTVTIASTTALTFRDPPGPTSLQLIIKQDEIGHTVAFPSYLKWPNGNEPSVTSSAEAIDVLSLLYDGQTYLATLVRNFS